ncbi:penicillin acylase family protein [Pseudoalteromonas sp. OOF1S-7]|uniref:penicillin acylase family protein n=1 Tax=Pseudoalteromonas sp. OOF1S-7 TaxID=2917757 RepID=UPI001EF6D14E|nr:penicillin acylase family protein [Pseudoalteromonas sp. OOF1S-7]MCG7537732.1 penicillin acylase family protein [Pseudoalteromonas sp. OOF1S-7]
MQIKNWFTRHPLLCRFGTFILAPSVLCAYVAYQQQVLSALPPTGANTVAATVHEPVVITRDTHGVPYIEAGSAADAYFAMGYLHAQDRLWQLELQRRLSAGKLSEVFGKESLNYDVWVRTLGLYAVAEHSKAHLSEQALASLQAYAAGINDFLRQQPTLPVEFTMLGITPEPWRVEDSLAWMKMFSLSMSGNLEEEIQRSVALRTLPKTLFTQFFESDISQPVEPLAQGPVASLSGLHHTIKQLEKDYKVGGKHIGSNAWVVSAEKSATGYAILANDPHLGLQIPSLWYAVSQDVPDNLLQGMSLVGLPVIVFGQNNQIAWGGTNMEADLQDLVVEQVHPDDPNLYRYQQQWLPFTSRTEYIKVKSDFPSVLKPAYRDVELKIKETLTGPVISKTGLPQAVSLRWTALQAKDSTYDGFFHINRAQNWSEFKAAADQIASPSLNLFYVDKQNNIGFTGAGNIPIRQQGTGILPATRAAHGDVWQGFIPKDEMPSELNPPRGYIINANNRNVAQDYPYHVSSSFADPARANRIEQLLDEQPLDLDYIKLMQMDVKDLTVTRLKAVMETVKAEDLWQQEALDQLSSWQGEATADSIAATLFYTWSRQIYRVLLNDELIPAWNEKAATGQLLGLRGRLSYDQLAELLLQDSPLCDDSNTLEIESCDTVLLSALDRTLIMNSKLHGDEIEDWQWGKFQTTRYDHMPFGKVKHLNTVFSREVATGGSSNTVNVAAGFYEQDSGFIQNYGAGFRQVIDMGGRYQFMNSTGQSGQVASQHYDDMVAQFAQGQYISFELPAKATHKLTLIPKTGQE